MGVMDVVMAHFQSDGYNHGLPWHLAYDLLTIATHGQGYKYNTALLFWREFPPPLFGGENYAFLQGKGPINMQEWRQIPPSASRDALEKHLDVKVGSSPPFNSQLNNLLRGQRAGEELIVYLVSEEIMAMMYDNTDKPSPHILHQDHRLIKAITKRGVTLGEDSIAVPIGDYPPAAFMLVSNPYTKEDVTKNVMPLTILLTVTWGGIMDLRSRGNQPIAAIPHPSPFPSPSPSYQPSPLQ